MTRDDPELVTMTYKPDQATEAVAALPDDAHLFTVDSLAAALHDCSMRCNQSRHYCADPHSPGSGHLRDARKLIQAAKEASE